MKNSLICRSRNKKTAGVKNEEHSYVEIKRRLCIVHTTHIGLLNTVINPLETINIYVQLLIPF